MTLKGNRIAADIRDLSIAAFFLSLAALIFYFALSHRLGNGIQEAMTRAYTAEGQVLGESLGQGVAAQLKDSTATLDERLADISVLLDARMASIQSESKAQLALTRADLDSNLAEIRRRVDNHLAHVDALADQAAATALSAQREIDTFHQFSPDLYRRASIASIHADNLIQRVDVATPAFLASSQRSSEAMSGILVDTRKVTDKLTAPTTAKGRVWSMFKLLINPVAWIGTKF